MDGDNLSIAHELLFDDEYQKYEGDDRFDVPLSGLISMIGKNPWVFDVIPNNFYHGLPIRIAKTDEIQRDGNEVYPRMKIYFAVDESQGEILLIFIESF